MSATVPHDEHARFQAGETPLLTSLLNALEQGHVNAHALPASRMRIVLDAIERTGSLDASFAGKVLGGSIFRPDPGGPLATAQDLAAQACGADATFFSTGGSTGAIQMATESMRRLGVKHAVTDLSCHQQVHMALDRYNIEAVTADAHSCSSCQRTFTSTANMLNKIDDVAGRHGANTPLGVVVGTAGYDGVNVDMGKFLAEIAKRHSNIVLLADEAWNASHAFSPHLRRRATLAAARRVQAGFPDMRLEVLVSQSVHKTMPSLRQAAWLHIIGSDRLREAVTTSLYTLHTTSPSLPLLASIDLGRAEMAEHGRRLMDQSQRSVQSLRRAIEQEAGLRHYRVLADPPASCTGGYVFADPTKIMIDTRRTGVASRRLQDALFNEGVWLSRIDDGIALVHCTTAVDEAAVHQILDALRAAAAGPHVRPVGKTSADGVLRSTGWLFAYPPGRPLVRPGQEITDATYLTAQRALDAGVSLTWVVSLQQYR